MPYSSNLEKLRQAGVIDCTLSLGCQILIPFGKEKHQYTILDNSFKSEKGNNTFYCRSNAIRAGSCMRLDITEILEILGHKLTIGRVLRWCDNQFTLATTGLKPLRENTSKILSLRHNKDLPLDDQENREEIAEFLVSLIG